MDLHVPSAETIRSYESLTTAGILLLILAVFGGAVAFVAAWAGKLISNWVKDFALKHLAEMTAQSTALQNMSAKQEQLQKVQESWHTRLDRILQCWAPDCPMRPTRHHPPSTDYDPIPPPARNGIQGPPTGGGTLPP